MKRILGIDPGSRITGFGIIEQNQLAQPICVLVGCIRLVATDMPTRLRQLFAQIQEIVKSHKPTELAIEQIFVHKKNPNAILKLGQARGVAIAAAAVCDMPVFEYAPRQIKQAVVGKGSADKKQIQHMIKILLGLTIKPQADAADALAIALCHLHTLSGVQYLNTNVPSRRRYKRTTGWKTYDRTTPR